MRNDTRQLEGCWVDDAAVNVIGALKILCAATPIKDVTRR